MNTKIKPLTDLPPHLQQLNPQQLEAVRHGEGPLLIFAGAGSGKTRVLTHRIANLMWEFRVDPSSILAVTFTNKAALEMKQRVMRLFGGRHFPGWVSTFHSACAQILRRHATLLDYTSSFAIYDTNDTTSALKRVYKKLNIDPRILDIGMVRNRIDRAKNWYQFPEDVRADRYLPEQFAQMIADVFERYQAELKASNAMDFGDLLRNVVTLFKLEPNVLAGYQGQFSHFLIDEYQDTNRVQYHLVKMLAEQSRNLCVVGDDDQSIYAFRGATIENILNFKRDFPEAKVVTLELNYRSTKNILAAANSIIVKNKTRQKKSMQTDNPSGKPITSFRAYDERGEAEFVVQEIAALLREGIPLQDIAVFYRTNAQSRAVEEAFCEAGIPYNIYGSHRFYERKEIKDILSYFRLILNPDDNEAFLRVINVPTRGIGATTVGQLISIAEKRRQPLYPTVQQLIDEGAPQISAATRGKLAQFRDLFEELRADADAAERALTGADEFVHEKLNALPQLLKIIAETTHYLDRLKAEDTVESESRIENIYELFEVALEFSSRALEESRPLSLRDFLDRVSLTSDLDKENKTSGDSGDKVPPKESHGNKDLEDRVSLMTLHLCKGLEFDVVFLVGMEEGVLPHIRSLEDRAALEEERRLCYVGITRARKRLYLCRALTRQTYGRGSVYSGEPSRFLGDLPRGLIEERQTAFLD